MHHKIILSSHTLPQAGPSLVRHIVSGAKKDAVDVLDFDPDRFLFIMANMEEGVFLEYLEQESLKDIAAKAFRAYYHLMAVWKERYGDGWELHRSSMSHFLGNLMMRMNFVIKNDAQWCSDAMRVLRFLGVLAESPKTLHIFQESKQRMDARHFQIDPWLEAMEKDLWIFSL